MSAIITESEWLAALDQSNAPAADALNIKGWSERLHLDVKSASRWVGEGLKHGWMVRAPILITELTGRVKRAVGFRIVTPPKKRRR